MDTLQQIIVFGYILYQWAGIEANWTLQRCWSKPIRQTVYKLGNLPKGVKEWMRLKPVEPET